MPFYVRLGPHGLIIAIGAVLHTRLGRTIYRRRKRRNQAGRGLQEHSASSGWRLDAAENLTSEPPFVHIVRGSTTERSWSENRLHTGSIQDSV
jgi:hypothetical protein